MSAGQGQIQLQLDVESIPSPYYTDYTERIPGLVLDPPMSWIILDPPTGVFHVIFWLSCAQKSGRLDQVIHSA